MNPRRGELEMVTRYAAVIAVAFLAAGCASTPSAPSASPSILASVVADPPTPSATTQPAATPTPTRTPSPAASPSPRPTLKPITDVFASKRTEVTWNKLTAAERALYVHHPEFESITPQWNLIDQNLMDCGGVQVGDQRAACGTVVWLDYLIYKESGVQEALSAAVLAYQWALGQGIDKAWLDAFVTNLP